MTSGRAVLPTPEPVPLLARIERRPDGGREREGMIALDRNERLAPLPDWFMEELRAALASSVLTGYPVTDRLYDQLAEHLGVARERLLLTPGSDAAYRALTQAYARPGADVVILDPSYATYPVYSEMAGASVVAIPFERDLSLDPDRLLAAIEPGVGLVLIANPNQPTGTVLEEDVLRAVVIRAAEVGALVSIDEAYYPFSPRTVLDWSAEHANLLVTRTFSKAWGLAGLRVGVVAAEPAINANLFKTRSVYDINSLAVLCVSKLLAHPEIAADYVAEVDAGRELLSERARSLGIEPLPSETNFLQMRFAAPQQAVAAGEKLHERGYLTRYGQSADCLADCLRVTLGPPALMEQFAGVLAEVVS